MTERLERLPISRNVAGGAASVDRARTQPSREPPARWNPADESTLGVPADHPLALLIARALRHAEFAARWSDPSDHSFRALAALAFARRPGGKWRSAEFDRLIEQLCFVKRVEMLNAWFGTPEAGRLLGWLPRVVWPAMTSEDWDGLRILAGEEAAISPLGQVREITPVLIRQFRFVPEAFRLPPILAVIAHLDVPAARWERLQDCYDRADAEYRRTLVRAAGSVTTIGGFWDFYFRAEGTHRRPFNLPKAIHESVLLEPISTPAAMEAEALRLRNCLAGQSSQVRNGSRVYFRPRDGALINAALVRQDDGWAPGEILGPKNQPVAAGTAAPLRAELERLATHMPLVQDPSAGLRNSDIEAIRARAREQFSASDVEQVAEALRRIQHRSLSWDKAAFAIFQTAAGEYVQFLASPDGMRFIFEISSHRYVEEVNECLTADVVELIERSGCEWPLVKANFRRWFRISSAEDLQAVAELALAVLARMFQYASGAPLTIKVNIPEEAAAKGPA